MAQLLEIRDLSVHFRTEDGLVHAVSHVDFDLGEGEVLGVVGESGSGKSQTWLAVMGLLAQNGYATGSVKLHGRELLGLSPSQLSHMRGVQLAMIFQDPMTALNPYLTIGRQMTEVLQWHQKMRRSDAEERAIKALEAVHISDAGSRLKTYPHEFSGGMRQRVMIAMNMLAEPEILICDEPTTALDVTVQAQILALLNELRERFGTAIVFITHDLGVIAQIADRVAVLYGGRMMEQADVYTLFEDYRHPYTEGLLRSVPRMDEDRTERLLTIPGNPPNLAMLPKGCPFSPRCAYVEARCQQQMPELEAIAPGHVRACFHTGELGRQETGA